MDLITTAEAAKLMRVAPGTVRYWRHIGYGPTGFRVGGRVLYDRTEVEQWLRDQRMAASTGPGGDAA